MTLAGIITMLLSIGAVWLLLILCSMRLLRNPRKTEGPSHKKH